MAVLRGADFAYSEHYAFFLQHGFSYHDYSNRLVSQILNRTRMSRQLM